MTQINTMSWSYQRPRRIFWQRQSRRQGDSSMLTIGDRFPAFTHKAVVSLDKGKEFEAVTGQDHPGKWKVVFFWPKDFTFVCPTEIAAFGKRNRDFQDRDAHVLGVSTDNEYVHLAW